MKPAPPTSARRTGYTIVEMIVAPGVFALGSPGIWECISVTFFLTETNPQKVLRLRYTPLRMTEERGATITPATEISLCALPLRRH